MAFYTFGEVYSLMDKKDRKIEALKLSISNSPKTELDVKVRVLAGLELIYELTIRSEFNEVSRVVKDLFTSTDGNEFKSEDYWVFSTFTKIESLLKQAQLAKEQYLRLLDVFEETTSSLSGKRRSWWLAEVYKRKGGLNGITPEAEHRPADLLRALNHAVDSENYAVLLEVSHRMGFAHQPVAKSIKELAQIQSYVILAICNDGGDIERLRTVGSNLINIWPNLQYHRLSEDDLPYWKPLHDGCTELEKSEFPSDLKPAVLVFLLLSVNKVTENEKYKKAVDWASSLIGNTFDKLPQFIRRYMNK